MPQYLIKQRQGWYATLEVPKALRGKIGKARFKETLHTDSLKVAEIRKHDLISRWKKEIEAARGTISHLDTVLLVRQQRERAIQKGLKPSLTSAGVDFLMAVAGPASTLTNQEKTELSEVNAGKKFPFKPHIPDYEKSLVYVEEKTRDQQISDLQRFVKKFAYAEQATNRQVKEWIETNLIHEQGLSVRTCKRIMTACRGFWSFLTDRKSLDLPAPFNNVVPAANKVKTVKQTKSEERRHFTPTDYKRLLEAAEAKKDDQLCHLIKVAGYSGCRIEEICSLKLENVEADRIVIQDAKSEAGWREVPLHNKIVCLVAELKKTSSDGYLICGLSDRNKYKSKSDAIGKRFTTLKRGLGYSNQYVFHSFRKGFATLLEAAEVNELITARIMGHKIATMSYGRYSGGGVTFQSKKEAINKINWE